MTGWGGQQVSTDWAVPRTGFVVGFQEAFLGMHLI